MRARSRSRSVASPFAGRVALSALVLVAALALSVALGLGAPSRAGAQEAGYAGSEVCESCHADILESFSHTVHAKALTPANGRTERARRGCEACHGPGQAHVEAGGGPPAGMLTFRGEPESVDAENAACLGCHAGGNQAHWKGSPHQSADLACTTCHRIKKPVSHRALLGTKTQMGTCTGCHLLPRAQMYRNAHMPVREGKMDCGSCHNPHGSVADALMKHPTVNENCYSCHAEKRGPFLWEHPPVAEDCRNCHVPHGTPRPGMLRSGVPRLCQQCHIASRHPSSPQLPDSRFVLGRSCLNCHPNVHGSNHPSGEFFTR